MPIPLAVGRLNRAGFNRLTRPVAAHLPGFGVVHDRGPRSGRPYRTPLNLFTMLGWLHVEEVPELRSTEALGGVGA